MKPFKPGLKRFIKYEKRHIMTDEDMAVLYEGFNETFFSSRLPRYIKVRFVPSSKLKKINKHHEADAAWRPGVGEIWIDKIYARSEAVCCTMLLHEMAHAALEGIYTGHPGHNPGHGMIYQAELYRLFMAGAYDELL